MPRYKTLKQFYDAIEAKNITGPVELDLYYQRSDVDATALAKAITVAGHLIERDLSWNKIKDVGAIPLISAITRLERIRATIEGDTQPLKINLNSTEIGDASVVALAELIPVARRPLILRLSGNNITAPGAIALANAMKIAKQPITLELEHSKMSSKYISAFAEAIKVANQPLRINLSLVQMCNDAAIILAEGIKDAKQPVTLSLHSNEFGDAGAIALAEAIKVTTQPVTLDLTKNGIHGEGMRALAEAIKFANNTVKLEFFQSGLDDSDAIAFAEAIKVTKQSVVLDFQANERITDAGVIALAEALTLAKQSVTLLLAGSGHSRVGQEALIKALNSEKCVFGTKIHILNPQLPGVAEFSDVQRDIKKLCEQNDKKIINERINIGLIFFALTGFMLTCGTGNKKKVQFINEIAHLIISFLIHNPRHEVSILRLIGVRNRIFDERQHRHIDGFSRSVKNQLNVKSTLKK